MVSEYLEGVRFVAWLKANKLRHSHLPLGVFQRSIKQLAKMKASGVVKGVPDYVVVLKNKVLFIELKRLKGGRVSPEQKEWISALEAAGCPSKVCKGAAEAIEFVKGFL